MPNTFYLANIINSENGINGKSLLEQDTAPSAYSLDGVIKTDASDRTVVCNLFKKSSSGAEEILCTVSKSVPFGTVGLVSLENQSQPSFTIEAGKIIVARFIIGGNTITTAFITDPMPSDRIIPAGNWNFYWYIQSYYDSDYNEYPWNLLYGDATHPTRFVMPASASDTTPPSITFNPTTQTFTNQDISVQITVADTTGINQVWYQWTNNANNLALDDPNWIEQTTNKTNFTLTRSNIGTWYLHIKATDTATTPNTGYSKSGALIKQIIDYGAAVGYAESYAEASGTTTLPNVDYGAGEGYIESFAEASAISIDPLLGAGEGYIESFGTAQGVVDNEGVLSGDVKFKSNNLPVENVKVVAYNQITQNVYSGNTLSDGTFSITVEVGKYTLFVIYELDGKPYVDEFKSNISVPALN